MRIYKTAKGISLLEVIFVVSIVSGILIIGIPGYQSFLSKAQAYVAIEKLNLAINHARSEAINRQQVVRLCPSGNGQDCNPQGQWEQGWITYIDKTSSSLRTADDPIIQIQQALDGVLIRKNGRDKTVKFNQYGKIGLNRSFSICYSYNLKPISRLVIIHSGRTRIDKQKINCN